jgi:intracellular multiplication protein IcmK
MKHFVITTSLLMGLTASAFAQQAAPQTRPPANNLGKEVKRGAQLPEVVYPRPDEAVEDAVGNIEDAQLTPEQIKRLKQLFLDRERDKAMPYVQPPKPITRTLFLNLDPGVTPPALRLSRGQSTSIVFSDTNGDAWLIESVRLNRQLFSDGKQADGGEPVPTNVLSIEPLTPAAYGNVTVKLRGLSTPVIFTLTAAQKEVDIRVDGKVPGRNPDATSTVAITAMPTIDGALPYFLDGVPPKDARRLKVTGMDGVEAWAYQDSLYVRAKADAQYPAYTNAAKSTSGVAVYRYANLHSSVTFLTGGQAVTVFIE